jgi:hypothetical protein
MAVAAVMTAWAAFQGAKWHGVQAANTIDAAAAGAASHRATTEAFAQKTVDVGTFLQWLQAVRDDLSAGAIDSGRYVPDPNTFSGFIAARFRSEFKPAFDAWIVSRPLINKDAAPTPFQLTEYALEADTEAARLAVQAETQVEAAHRANERAENYVLLTVLFAIALVLGSLSGKLQNATATAITLGMSGAIVIGATLALVTFPIEL